MRGDRGGGSRGRALLAGGDTPPAPTPAPAPAPLPPAAPAAGRPRALTARGPLPWAAAGLRAAAADLRGLAAAPAGARGERFASLLRAAWAALACAAEGGSCGGAGAPGARGAHPRGRALGEDTYAESLVHTNRLISAAYGRKTRRVPAHMPHLIDTVALSRLQAAEGWAAEYARTSSHRFRAGSDVQYAFAYFHFLLEGGARDHLDVAAYFSAELDADGDGALSANELYTLGAIVHKRSPTGGELAALRSCLVGEGAPPAVERTSRPDPAGGGVIVEERTTLHVRHVTWDTIMGCALVRDALSRNARFGPSAQDMGATTSGEEVAFEMVGDDFNKTREQLDAVRAKRPRFICINDNMAAAPPQVVALLADFFESFYGRPCPVELPPGVVNPVLYIEPLRQWHREQRAKRALGAALAALAVLLGAGLALASWAESEAGGAAGAAAAARNPAVHTPRSARGRRKDNSRTA